MYRGDIRLGDTIDVKFTTRSFTTGAPTQLAGSPVISAYVGNSTTQITAGITLTVDFDAVTGLNNVRVVASGGNGYATASNYDLVITTGTVGGVSVVGEVIGSFSIEARSALMPTTVARTLDVTATGAAGIDWGNVENPTTAVNLSGTNIDTDQVVASVTGAVGSVTGAVGSVTGAVGSVTGNVGGNVTGSVGSVTGLTNATIADAVWDEDATAHQTQGTFGQAIGDPAADTDSIWALVNTNLDATVSSRLATSGYTAPPSAASVADAVWDEATAGHASAGTYGLAVSDILTDTAVIGAAGAGLSAIPWNAAWDAEVQSEVADGLTAYGAATATDVTSAAANVSVDEIQVTALADLFNTNSGTTYASAVAGSVVKEIADNAGGSALTEAGIADAVWDELLSGHAISGSAGEALSAAGTAGDPWTTSLPGAYGAGTAGYIIGTNLDGTVSSRASQTSVNTIDDFLDTEIAAILADTNELQTDWANGGRLDLILDARASQTSVDTIDDFLDTEVSAILAAVDTEVAAIKAKTDNLPAAPAAVGDIPTAVQNADALLGRNVAGGSSTGRTVKEALYVLRNKIENASGTLTVYGVDDTTPAFTAAVTTTAGDPVTAIDPA